MFLLKHVKNPIRLAREMLIRGQSDGTGGHNGGDSGDPAGGSGGAQGHVCLGGETAESLAKDWGLEMVDQRYFWTRKRWEEHLRGLDTMPNPEHENEMYEPFISAIKEKLLISGFRGMTVDELYASLRASNSFELIPSVIIAMTAQRLPPSWDRRDGHKAILLFNLYSHSAFYCVCAHNSKVDKPDYGRDRWRLALHPLDIELHLCYGKKDCVLGDVEGWDGHEYLPQGTVGCVALDQYVTVS